MNLYRLSGYASVLFGTIATVLLLNPFWLLFSLFLSILGFAFSTINIYLNAKYEITKSNFSLGYVGMVLASFPILFLLILIIRK